MSLAPEGYFQYWHYTLVKERQQQLYQLAELRKKKTLNKKDHKKYSKSNVLLGMEYMLNILNGIYWVRTIT